MRKALPMPGPLEPYPNWHCVWIEQAPDGWTVKCHPHGEVTFRVTHIAAFEAAIQHDIDNGTYTGGGME